VLGLHDYPSHFFALLRLATLPRFFFGFAEASRAPRSAASNRRFASLSLNFSSATFLERFAMAPRKPPPNLRTTVYIDESSQTKYHYCVIGALVIPTEFAEPFEQAIIDARGNRHPHLDADGMPRIIKWEKAQGGNDLVGYSNVLEAYRTFPRDYNMPSDQVLSINCIAVDMTKKDDKQFSGGDADLGFNKEVNFLCTAVVGRKHYTSLFEVYPDFRTTKQPLLQSLYIMNATAAKYEDETRFMPFRRLEWSSPKKRQALQVLDIVIGALAYKLNGHYDAEKPNKTKRALCDKVLKMAKIGNILDNTPIYLNRITLFHRNYSTYKKK
jgi:hypothetical protein